ncbi:hypothetical protein C8024_04245 [Sphingopyxis sp. BSNA05]|uniref:GAF domain-containing protein n=1 Tax=Sphingopyxis sp. BSNA05 TaxID=1236614 RepID=UPI00156726C9|nr:GAF domain-containing protein [Sphingopyxis sp. BSNA05]NRD88837.1 hypothetical protein [Sphingopyxis sp. BSNA05]
MTEELEPTMESERLATLGSYQVMDDARRNAFDRITRLVADIFAAPVASISLIEKDRELFRSAVGLAETDADRKSSLCGGMVDSHESLVIEDASVDPRFSNNPLVSGGPAIRFYAGAPLIAPNGMVLGALWFADTVPRCSITANQLDQLKTMADIVMSELELSREIRLREQAQKNAAIDRSNLDLTLALSDIASFRTDLETGKIEWGGAYMKIWGEDAGEALTQVEDAFARIHPEDRESVTEAMSAAAAPGENMKRVSGSYCPRARFAGSRATATISKQTGGRP